jgi:hypothetical protein
MAKVINIVMFPPILKELNEEIRHHPRLQEVLDAHPVEEFEIRIAQMAAWLGIVLDGTYSHDDFIKLYGIMLAKLREKRTGVTTAFTGETPEGLTEKEITLQ